MFGSFDIKEALTYAAGLVVPTVCFVDFLGLIKRLVSLGDWIDDVILKSNEFRRGLFGDVKFTVLLKSSIASTVISGFCKLTGVSKD